MYLSIILANSFASTTSICFFLVFGSHQHCAANSIAFSDGIFFSIFFSFVILIARYCAQRPANVRCVYSRFALGLLYEVAQIPQCLPRLIQQRAPMIDYKCTREA
jgi:hypothetical protein